MFYHPQSILVTGGAGFIGANFIHYLLKKNTQIKIVNLDALTYAGSLDNLSNLSKDSNYQFIHGDICNRKLLDELLKQHKIDTIVHFAAESHVDRSISRPAAFIQTNIVGTFTLLEAARECWTKQNNFSQNCRFHHISTDEVYGTLNNTDPPFTELTPYSPNSPYAASKASSDHLVNAYAITYGLPITISNCSNNYGPFQHSEKFIPTIINSCLDHKPIPIYGNGRNIRDWLYVEDHCEAIETIITQSKPGKKYNIGGDNEYENIEVVKKICQLMDKILPHHEPYENLITYVKDRPGHDWRYAINFNKINQELNWQPKTKFEDGLLKTIEFIMQARSNLNSASAPFPNIA